MTKNKMTVASVQREPLCVVDIDVTIKELIDALNNTNSCVAYVVDNNKLVGMITIIDIQQELFSLKDASVKNPLEYFDIELINAGISRFVNSKIKKVFVLSKLAVHKDTSIANAQLLLLIKNIANVPVVNDAGDLVGEVTQDRIIRYLVDIDHKVSCNEKYLDWVATYFDYIWGDSKRYEVEANSIADLLEKYGIGVLADVGSGTGGHAVELAKKNIQVIPLDENKNMYRVCMNKINKLDEKSKQNINAYFVQTYHDFLATKKNTFHGISILGNLLAHRIEDYEAMLKDIYNSLRKEGICIIQLTNFDVIFKSKKRLQSINQGLMPDQLSNDIAVFEYVDPPTKSKRHLTLTIEIFQMEDGKWRAVATKSTYVADITKNSIVVMLGKLKFRKIKVYGSNLGKPMFNSTFNKKTHDWLNIVAVK